MTLQVGNGDFPTVEDAGGQRGRYLGLVEYVHEVLHIPGATGGYQRYRANFLNGDELLDVIAVAHAVGIHAIEHDFADTEILCLRNPVNCIARCPGDSVRVAGVLIHLPGLSSASAVNAQHHTLRSKPSREIRNQARIFQCRRIDRNLVGSSAQDVLGGGDGANAARDAKRDVEQGGDTADPVSVDRAVVRACGNVVEHEFVGTRLTVGCSKIEYVADDAMVAKLYALDDFAVANVETRNYAAGRNVAISFVVIFPSRRARPLMAAPAPIFRNALRSSILRTPPDACS